MQSKKENENIKTEACKIKLTGCVRFMCSSLSSLTDNLAKELQQGKCKDCKSSLEYVTAKEITLTFKCVDCNKNYEKDLDEDLANRFQNNLNLCHGDINKFCPDLAERSMKRHCQTIKNSAAI